MNISIKVLDKKPEIIWNMPCYFGEIQIGDFKESLDIPVEYWSLEDYKKQWEEGLERIKHKNTSCLVAAVQDPLKAPLVDFWVLYKDTNAKKIYVQNHLLLDEQLKNRLFTPETCYEFIEPRDFDPNIDVSEWEIDIDF